MAISRKIHQLFDSVMNRLPVSQRPPPLKVIITGPPRSGTSFLCGVVSRFGISPGPERWLKKGDSNNKYGYYECMPLMEIDHGLLKKFGGGTLKPPILPENWQRACVAEKHLIKKIVQRGGVELYKCNMLVYIADLYADLFPEAKWIMIQRGWKENVRSIQETGSDLSTEELFEVRKDWLQCWGKTHPAKNCLTIQYEDFTENSAEMVKTISEFLHISLSNRQVEECVSFFRPRS